MKRFRTTRFLVCLGALVLSTATRGFADPDSGTISPGSPTLTYVGGPYNGANPSNNVEDEPDCALVPGTCDDFLLTIDLPAGYVASNPDHLVTVKIEWDPSNPANDVDVYIQDPVSGLSKEDPAATSGNPEVATISLVDGSTDCRIRCLMYAAVDLSFTGTITLGPPGGDQPTTGTYAASDDVWSCNVHLEGLGEIPSVPPTIFDHSLDAEPSCRIGPDGRVFVTAIAGVPAGAGLWVTSDACAQAYEFLGAPDAGIGGGDSDVEIAPEPNVLGFNNIYMSSLTLANITSSFSFDGGANFTSITPVSTPVPIDDRQWNAPHGSSIVYLSYRNGATQPGNLLEVVRLDYSGLAAPIIVGPTMIWDPILNPPTAPKQLGNMATDRRPLPGGSPPFLGGPDGEGNVYHGFTQNENEVWVANSQDFGLTWTNVKVFEGPLTTSYEHVFTWNYVDLLGNIYTTFSDDHNVYYSVSTDEGATWRHPVRINRGGESRTSIFSHVAAGSEGRAVFAWYGHDGSSSDDATADWKVFVSRTENAFDPVPHFEERIVSDRQFHVGEVCQGGLGCSCCRELLECFEIDISPVDGSSFVCYASQASGTYMTRQVSGKSAIASVQVVDRSGECPVPPECESPPPCPDFCACPGCLVVADLDGEDQPPVPDPRLNIQAISVAEPFGDPRGDDVLLFSMQVEDLDETDVPPNSFWRIIFGTPGGQFYVRVVNCTLGGLSGDYGTFDTGSVTLGPLLDFEIDAGLICMWIDRQDVGNPVVSQLITGINGDTRLQGGNCPGGPAVFPPVDVSNSGQYEVRGNSSCGPVALFVSSLTAEKTPQGVDVSWESHAAGYFARFDLYRGLSREGPWEPVHRSRGADNGYYLFHDDVRIAGDVFYQLTGTRRESGEVTLGTARATGSVGQPFHFQLAGPNPVRERTMLSFALPAQSHVRVELYNVAGRRLRTLVDRVHQPGVHTLSFDTVGDDGRRLASGVYLVRIQAASFEETLRLVTLD